MDVINGNVQIEQRPDIKINTAEADLIEIIIVRLGGENQDQKGLVDFLYGLFSGNQEKVLSYIPDSDKPVRQKEVADMLSMISYAEENGIKKGVKPNESRLKYITTKTYTYTPNTIFASIFSFRLISRATFKVGSHLPDI